jgi:hypothetical protein
MLLNAITPLKLNDYPEEVTSSTGIKRNKKSKLVSPFSSSPKPNVASSTGIKSNKHPNSAHFLPFNTELVFSNFKKKKLVSRKK